MDFKANLPPADLCLEQAMSYNRSSKALEPR